VNQLSPLIVKKDWTEEDDALLIAMQFQHKNKWSEMTQYFPGSTANAIKNRFNLLKRKVLTENTTKITQGSCVPIKLAEKRQSKILMKQLIRQVKS
jgi:hypothetical protein